jgi:HSP20 family protein
MAKMSKKPTSPEQALASGEMVQFIMENMMEGMEDCLRLRGPEPINYVPHVDIFSTEKELIVEVELPGVNREDIDVSLFKSALNIKALKYECLEENKVNYVCMERAFGRIFRSIELPMPVNSTKIKACYKNGVLTIVMPRIEEKRGKPKQIAVELT